MNSKILLEVENVGFVLKLRSYTSSMRESFVQMMDSPVKFFFQQPDRHIILNDISFQVREGDRIAILGRNGAGKSTLCRLLAGIYRPTKGRVQKHAPIKAFFDTQMGVNYELTGKENAEVLAEFIYPEMTPEDKAEAIAESLEFSELGKFVHAPLKTYSNGMLTRLCLSLITAKPTSLLILDEVAEGADRFFREKVKQRLQKQIDSSGAVLLISHYEDSIIELANRVFLIENGRLEVFDDPKLGFKKYFGSNR